MDLSPFVDPPVIQIGSLVLLFGQSRSGKSTWLTNLLVEHKHHFEHPIKQLVCIYQREDTDTIGVLKEKFAKNGTFVKHIPDDLEQWVVPHSVIIFDDCENLVQESKKNRKLLRDLATITCHHSGITVFFCFQTYGVFYAKNPLNAVFHQATNLVLFRSMNNSYRSLKFWLNSYEMKLRNSCTLFDIFMDYVLAEQFNYIMINLYPNLSKPQVFAQILQSDRRPLLCFHEE